MAQLHALPQPYVETADAMFSGGETPPAIVVYVDAWKPETSPHLVARPTTGGNALDVRVGSPG